MTHVDLFSGIAGFALAAKWTWGEDYHNLAHSEIEKYPCQVYHRHFPESECLGDITKIDWARFSGRVDLVTGGFPCQPHSVAGKRKGSRDERDLWAECVRALAGIRPRYAVFENVPGIITSEHGKTWEKIKVDLDSQGYEGIPVLFSAAEVGAPHRRVRVWVIAHTGDGGSQEIASHPKYSSPTRQRGNSGEILSVTESIRPDIGNSNDSNSERVGWTKGAGQGIQPSKQKSEGQNARNADTEIGWNQNWLEVATALCRVDDGLPRQLHRVERLKALGNAIVPQVATVLLGAIKEIDDPHR